MAETSTTRIPGTVFQLGYLTKGVIYVLIAILAVRVAIGAGSPTAGATGALEHVGTQPFGQVLLWLLAVGLFMYATWRFIDGFLDASDRGSDSRGALKRIGVIVSGLVYAVIGITAIRTATADAGWGGATKQEATAWLMAQPAGVALVGLIGALIAAMGLYQLWLASRGHLSRHFHRLAPELRDRLRTVSRVGFAARGVAFGVIGALILYAAATHDPSDAGGLDRALQTLATQPFGPWLLGLIALGLLGYGVYCFCVASFGWFPDVEISGDTVRQLPSETTAH